MALKTLLAASLLALASAHAQVIDAGIRLDPFTFEVTPIVPGREAWLRWETNEINIRTQLCTPGVICVGDQRFVLEQDPRIVQHLDLGDSWSDAIFEGAPEGSHLLTHLAPPDGAERGSFANYRLFSAVHLELAPRSTLRLGYHVRMSVEPELATSLPYAATGHLELELRSYIGYVGISHFDVASTDYQPDYLDEAGFYTATNEYDAPMTLWLRTIAAIDTSIPPVPEPHTWGLVLCGLAVLGLARRLRRSAAGIALAALAATPLAQAQQLDGALQLGATEISWNGGPAQLVDWNLVMLRSGFCFTDTDCHFEESFRYDTPETFEHHRASGAQWLREAFHGDAEGASAVLHLEMEAPISTGVSASIATRIVYRLEPGTTISLSMPVSGWVQPSDADFDYELSVYAELEGHIGNYAYFDNDTAEAVSIGGSRATMDEMLTITLTNPNTWADFATITAWGHLEANVTVVPEPPPLAMLAAGLAVLPMARKMRRRATRLNAPDVSP